MHIIPKQMSRSQSKRSNNNYGGFRIYQTPDELHDEIFKNKMPIGIDLASRQSYKSGSVSYFNIYITEKDTKKNKEAKC